MTDQLRLDCMPPATWPAGHAPAGLGCRLCGQPRGGRPILEENQEGLPGLDAAPGFVHKSCFKLNLRGDTDEK